MSEQLIMHSSWLNPIALRKAKIVYNFGLSECNRVIHVISFTLQSERSES